MAVVCRPSCSPPTCEALTPGQAPPAGHTELQLTSNGDLARHLDKGSDLLEEAASAGPGAGPGAGPAAGEAPRSASSGGLRELARSLKQHLLGFSERLEDTRERLEDTSRCFCLLDKVRNTLLCNGRY
ncbi:Uncharacterized protein GBIM_00195 [Gryllus bimaculatus]|nr:Uncharacterized protein GBIM_00195 [Gryllus bimaculatus]